MNHCSKERDVSGDVYRHQPMVMRASLNIFQCRHSACPTFFGGEVLRSSFRCFQLRKRTDSPYIGVVGVTVVDGLALVLLACRQGLLALVV